MVPVEGIIAKIINAKKVPPPHHHDFVRNPIPSATADTSNARTSDISSLNFALVIPLRTESSVDCFLGESANGANRGWGLRV